MSQKCRSRGLATHLPRGDPTVGDWLPRAVNTSAIERVMQQTVRVNGLQAVGANALVWQINGASYNSFNDIFHPNDVKLSHSRSG